MKRKLKLGVIGAGKIGRLHLDSVMNYIPDAEVVQVADPYITVETREWLNDNGVSSIIDDADALINNKDVEAVMILSSTNLHAEQIVKAAKAGKHIFCEKPVHFELQAILDTLKVVKESGVKFQIGFNRRFDHNFKRIFDVVQSGKIGSPHIVKITSRDPAPPSIDYVKVSGGLFMDMMIHDFDMIRYLSGKEVVSVSTRGGTLIDEKIKEAGDVDTAIVTVEFDDGSFGVIDNSRQAVYGYDQRAEVFGPKGCCATDNDTDTRVSVVTVDGAESDKPPYFFLQRYFQAYVDEMKSFTDAILNDKEVVCGMYDAIRPVVIAKAAGLSLKEGRTVKLDEILDETTISQYLG